jgi:predicted enzyme related to lactoylglutathione lyase
LEIVRGVDFIAVNIPAGSMEKAHDFYGITLGLEVDDPTDPDWREYDAGNATICVVADNHNVDPGDRRRNGGGGVTIALAVANIAETVASLQEKGVELRFAPNEHRRCTIAGIKDPFGNDLYLHERKDGTSG